jgi:hypothetical protein
MADVNQIIDDKDIFTSKAFTSRGGLRFSSLVVRDNGILEESFTVRANDDQFIFGDSIGGTFTTNDGKTITISNGIVTSIV